MRSRQNSRQGTAIILLLAASLLLASGGEPTLAAPLPLQETGGLLVNGAILDLQATPGLVYVHQMQVGTGDGAPAMDVTVEAMGFSESDKGEFVAVPADQDQLPFSALSYISAISQPSFRLEPGESVPVDVTLTIPADPGVDTRYAVIYVKGKPQSAGSVTQELAVLVPVIVTPVGAVMNRTGRITDFKVDPVESGKPIVLTTRMENTGNRHFRVRGDVTISDPAGEVVTRLDIPVSGTSVVPTFARQLVVTYSALEKNGGLPPGTYTAEVRVLLEDGTLLDSRSTTFEITQPYRPFPEIDDAHLRIQCFNDEEPGTIDARQTTDVMVTFEETGKVTGCVAIGKFPQEPEGSPRFADSLDQGGIGTQGVKFYGVQVQGFDRGLAHVAVAYQPDELTGLDANDLFLAIRGSSSWSKLDRLAVQTGAQLALGDVPVSNLQDGPVQALGVAALSPWAAILGQPLVLAAALLVAVLVLVAAVLIARQSVRRRQANPQAGP